MTRQSTLTARSIALVAALAFVISSCGGDKDSSDTADDSPGAAESSTPSTTEPDEATPSDEPSPSPTGPVLPTSLDKSYCKSLDLDAASALLGAKVTKADSSMEQGESNLVCSYKINSGKTGFVMLFRPEETRSFPDLVKTLEASYPCDFRDVPGLTPETAFQFNCAVSEDNDFAQGSVFVRVGNGSLECRLYSNGGEVTLPDADGMLEFCSTQFAAIA